MKTYTNSLDRERLETIWSQESQPQDKALKLSGLNKVWQRLLQFFVSGDELRIWQTQDHGKTWWHAYDSVTGRRTSVDSEEEMRSWIEQRYYQ